MDFVWTPEVTQNLRDWWAEGISASKIGDKLGIGKNAVLGKVHRELLPPRIASFGDQKWTADMRQRLRDAREVRKLTWSAIAKEFDCCAETARMQWRQSVDPDRKTCEPRHRPRNGSRSIPTPPKDTLSALMPASGQDRSAVPLPPVPAAVEPGPALKPVIAAPPPPPVTRFQPLRPTSCCWPIGEPGTKAFRFCSDRAVAGRSYCEQHCHEAYVGWRKEA